VWEEEETRGKPVDVSTVALPWWAMVVVVPKYCEWYEEFILAYKIT
jgi:hypothetical protein